MKNNSFSSIEKIISNPLIISLGAILAAVEPIRIAIDKHDLKALILYGVIVLILLFYIRARKKNQKQPLIRKIFKPFAPLDTESIWPRRNDQKELVNTILNGKGKPIVIVGDSGVGKSVLVEKQVLPILKEEGWIPLFFNNYSNIETQLINKLKLDAKDLHISENGLINGPDKDINKFIIIFDQFEQFLSSHSQVLTQNNQSRNWLHTLIKSFIKLSNTRMLLIVRKEWYYDLRFLDKFVPPPYNCFHLTGIRMDDIDGSIPTLQLKLADAMKNSSSADIESILQSLEINGEVSPVEAQIVGCMLENKSVTLGIISKETYQKELGGKDALVKEFFDLTRLASPNPDISLQILFALSIETRYRKHLKLDQIKWMIHQSHDEVIACLNYLIDQRLIFSFAPGEYQLTHDYLAERFHDISGSELDPVQRDNILFFGDEIRKKQTSQHHMTIFNNRPKFFSIASDWFMAFLVLLVFARLIAPMYGSHWGWFAHIPKNQLTYLGLDIMYAPVFLSHIMWSYYVTIFFRRIFYFFKENKLGRFLSYFTLITCTASVGLATIFPYFYIFSIGFGGLWIAIKLLHLSTTKGLSKVSKEAFRNGGWETFLNVIFPIGLGFLFGLKMHHMPFSQNSSNWNNWYYFVSVFGCIMLVYAFSVVRKRHVNYKSASRLIGLFDRRPSKIQDTITKISF